MNTINFEKTYLGIELGSTRVKAVLVDESSQPIASGEYEWENRFENGYWTYSLDDIHKAVKGCYADLSRDVYGKFGVKPHTFGAMGISAMMHGYMPFNESGRLLVPFRTWRNTSTSQAADELTELLNFNIPQRWSIAHLYQAILSKEEHVPEISYITTLSGYVHFLLTSVKALGAGDASGMFPLDGINYDEKMLELTQQRLSEKGFDKSLKDILPEVKTAGELCGTLTAQGAAFLDEEGILQPGVPFCPPEGDAGTGTTATNSVRQGTGNVSAGTSIFSMLVLEKPLSGAYQQLDVVTTPDGAPVAMVHCNNCCGEIDAWVKMFGEFAQMCGREVSRSELYEMLYKSALEASPDCDSITAFNFISDEPVADVVGGKPAYFRDGDSTLTLGGFFRAQLYSALASLKLGNDILFEKEKISASLFNGHGGLFKAAGAAQQLLADGLNTPVAVMTTAGEGGAWGMALLALYSAGFGDKDLADWLDSEVFAGMERSVVQPDKNGSLGFEKFMERYTAVIQKGKR